MAKIKYYYDTETCQYEQITPTFKSLLIRFSWHLLSGAILAGLFLFVTYTFYSSPKERMLEAENKALVLNTELQLKRIKELEMAASILQDRADNLHRMVYNTEPTNTPDRLYRVANYQKYKNLEGFTNSQLMIEIAKRVDNLYYTFYSQIKNYQDLFEYAKKHADELKHIPAIKPVKGTMNKVNGFGWRLHPILKIPHKHEGIDMGAPAGTPIYATADGVVTNNMDKGNGFGIYVELNHQFGYITTYAHMSKVAVKIGQHVKRGDVIGYVGSTGISTSPHLHYEVKKDGVKVDPIHYFFSDITPDEFKKLKDEAAEYGQSFD